MPETTLTADDIRELEASQPEPTAQPEPAEDQNYFEDEPAEEPVALG